MRMGRPYCFTGVHEPMGRTSCGAGALARVIEVESPQLAVRVPHEFVAQICSTLLALDTRPSRTGSSGSAERNLSTEK